MSGRSPAALKRALRAELVARRRAVAAAERARASQRIAASVLERVDWRAVSRLHLYRAVEAWGEIETAPLAAALRERWPHLEIVTPPASAAQPIPSDPFDLVIVPVLGFDRFNYRLGLGAGFYDRMLARQPHALTLGLAYAWAQLPELPREAHDVPLGAIVTDAGG